MISYQRNPAWRCPDATPEQLAASAARQRITGTRHGGCASCKHWSENANKWCYRYRYTEDAPNIRIERNRKLCDDFELLPP